MIFNYNVSNQVDSSYTTSGRESRNTYTFAATTEDNNARYRCESVNELSAAPHNAEIVLSVQCKLKGFFYFKPFFKLSILLGL